MNNGDTSSTYQWLQNKNLHSDENNNNETNTNTSKQHSDIKKALKQSEHRLQSYLRSSARSKRISDAESKKNSNTFVDNDCKSNIFMDHNNNHNNHDNHNNHNNNNHNNNDMKNTDIVHSNGNSQHKILNNSPHCVKQKTKNLHQNKI